MPFLLPPASVLASWPTPNYVDPTTRGWGPFVASIIFTSFAVLVFAGRMWTRLYKTRTVGLDDWLMLIGVLLLIALTVLICIALKAWPFGRHIYDVPLTKISPMVLFIFSAGLLFQLASGFIKVSVLCFYLRFTASTVTKRYKYITWACIAFVVAYTITFVIVVFTQCRPVTAYWKAFDFTWDATHSYTCADVSAVSIAATVISAVQDFIAAILPVPLFWNLKVPKRQKFALIGMFGLGFLVCSIACVRTWYFFDIEFITYDVTWTGSVLYAWSVAELALGVICASVPAFKVYFESFFRSSPQAASSSNLTPGSSSYASTGRPLMRSVPSITMIHDSTKNDDAYRVVSETKIRSPVMSRHMSFADIGDLEISMPIDLDSRLEDSVASLSSSEVRRW